MLGSKQCGQGQRKKTIFCHSVTASTGCSGKTPGSTRRPSQPPFLDHHVGLQRQQGWPAFLRHLFLQSSKQIFGSHVVQSLLRWSPCAKENNSSFLTCPFPLCFLSGTDIKEKGRKKHRLARTWQGSSSWIENNDLFELPGLRGAPDQSE